MNRQPIYRYQSPTSYWYYWALPLIGSCNKVPSITGKFVYFPSSWIDGFDNQIWFVHGTQAWEVRHRNISLARFVGPTFDLHILKRTGKDSYCTTVSRVVLSDYESPMAIRSTRCNKIPTYMALIGFHTGNSSFAQLGTNVGLWRSLFIDFVTFAKLWFSCLGTAPMNRCLNLWD